MPIALQEEWVQRIVARFAFLRGRAADEWITGHSNPVHDAELANFAKSIVECCGEED